MGNKKRKEIGKNKKKKCDNPKGKGNIQRTETKTIKSSNFTKIVKLITLFGGSGIIVSLLQFLVKYFVQMNYQNKCEQFYNIPYQYFFIDVNREIIMQVVAIIFLGLVFGTNYIMKVDRQTDTIIKIYSVFIELVIAVSFAYVMFISLTHILECINNDKLKWLKEAADQYVCVILLVIFVLSLVVVLGVNNCYIFVKIKNKILKTILVWVLGVISVGFLLIFFCAQVLTGENDVSNKHKYECIQLDNKDYAILSKLDGRFLAVEYYEKHDEVIIFTKVYKLIDCENVEITYKDWEQILIIEKKKSKEEYMKIKCDEK